MTSQRPDAPQQANGFDSLRFWLSPEGEDALGEAARILREQHNDVLRASTALRKRVSLPPEDVAAALEIALCRQKAARLGTWAERGFFTKQSLEQATAPAIAQFRAERFRGRGRVLEICAGAGFDTAAIARVAESVVAIEADARTAAMARRNLELQDVNNVEILCGKAEEICAQLDLAQFDGLWSDPSRREGGGRRLYDPEECSPALSWLQRLPIQGRCGVKLAPGADCAPIHLADGAWRRLWIGFGDECREQVLWKNLPDTQNSPDTPDAAAALIAPDGSLAAEWSAHDGRAAEPARWNGDAETLRGRYLLEPHAALIRTGKLADFYAERGFALFAERIAYGLSPAPPAQSPWYDAFLLLEAFPFHYSRLRERLAALGWGTRMEIKKRGFPETPDEIRRKLKLPRNSSQEGVLFCTRRENQHWAILAQRFRATDA